MTILLHGDNITASRNRLAELKAAGEIIELTPTDDSPQVTSLFAKEAQVVIWVDKKLSTTQIKDLEKKFPNLKVEEFKLDPVVFKFLNALAPGRQAVFLPLWQRYLTTEVPEVAFIMLVRQFRLMLNPADPDLLPWQKKSTAAQAKAFGSLGKIYKQLLDIDYQTKTGLAAVDLRTRLDLFLLKL